MAAKSVERFKPIMIFPSSSTRADGANSCPSSGHIESIATSPGMRLSVYAPSEPSDWPEAISPL
jgi:hypothetical protein